MINEYNATGEMIEGSWQMFKYGIPIFLFACVIFIFTLMTI